MKWKCWRAESANGLVDSLFLSFKHMAFLAVMEIMMVYEVLIGLELDAVRK